MIKNLKLYAKYASVCTQSVMQYKLSFLLMIIGRFILAFNELLAIKFLFSGFTELKGYTYGDVLLCFSVIQMSFTFAELFGNGFKAFSGMVRRGEFDRMMLRPCSLILQVIGTRFEIGRTGPLLTAAITLVEPHDSLDNGRDDYRRDIIIHRTVYAGSQFLLLFHRGYFTDQRAHIRRKIPWQISD